MRLALNLTQSRSTGPIGNIYIYIYIYTKICAQVGRAWKGWGFLGLLFPRAKNTQKHVNIFKNT